MTCIHVINCFLPNNGDTANASREGKVSLNFGVRQRVKNGLNKKIIYVREDKFEFENP